MADTALSSPPTASSAKTPILPLTSVRFFAAFYVVLLHTTMWTHRLDVSTWFGRFLRNGYTAVGFFFVLSGYILAHVYLNTDRPFSRRAFWTSRFARAYPLLFASLLLDAPNSLGIRLTLYGVKTAILRTAVAFTTEASLLQAWNARFRNINAPSWSLSAEAFFYLLFPFTAFWIWRRKGVSAAALLSLFWGSAMLTPILVTHHDPTLFFEVPTSVFQQRIELLPLIRIFEFFAGISLCALQQSVATHFNQAQRGRIAYLSLAAAALFFYVAIERANQIPLLVMSNGFLLPAYSLLILALVNIRGWLRHLLSHKVLVLLGESSYAVYLLHAPLWLYFSRIHPIDSFSLWLLFIALLLFISISSFYWLERPIRKLILAYASIRPSVTLKQEAVAPL